MDARVERTRHAVVDAATELLVEGGPAALTVDAVVARSGVAKSTLYRHWANRDDLVVDVFRHSVPTLDPPPEGASFDDALAALVDQMVEITNDETWRRFLPALVLLRSENPALADIDDEMKAQQTRAIREVLALGVTEGRLPGDALDDFEVSTHLLVGPLLMASMLDDVELDGEFARRATEQFLAGQQARLAPKA